MTSKTTTRTTSPKTNRKHSLNHSAKHSVKGSVKKTQRINRQRRLQKQLQALILERHSRRCIICHHPEREAIEEEFVHWRAPWKLSQDYKLNDYRTVYRHARAAGLLLQRRERLHSALDAFVESVDDVTFTGDTILRAMRAYSCIDSHGRWTEIPTQVQFSTSTDTHPPQPSRRSSTAASDILDVAPKYSNQPSRSDATTCASPPAQAFNAPNSDDDDDESEEDQEQENAPEERVTASDVLDVFRKYAVQPSRNDATAAEDEYDELEDDDSDTDEASEEDAEEGAENELKELVTASDVLNVVRKYANQASRSDATTADDQSEEAAENELEKLVTSRLTSSKSASRSNAACPTSSKSPSHSDTTACPTPSKPMSRSNAAGPTSSKSASRSDTTTCPTPSKPTSRSDTTACAASPAQPASAVPLNSNNRGRSVTATACATTPAQSASAVPLNSNNRGRSVTATACADSPAQALPRDVVRGQNPNDRSPSDRTDCAALPSGGTPAQPAAPQKPKPDADGLIWHPHPGYPNQERSEPDARAASFTKST